MKKLLLVLVLIAFVTVPLKAQFVSLLPEVGSGQLSVTHSTDSTSFYNRHYFLIPDGVDADSLQMDFWLYSEDGTPHVVLKYFLGMCLNEKQYTNSNVWKLSADSTSLSADYSTEKYTAFLLTRAAADTIESVVGYGVRPDGIVVGVKGYTGNRADTEYWIKIKGRKESYGKWFKF